MRRALGQVLYIFKESIMGQFENTALLESHLFSLMFIVATSNSQCLPIRHRKSFPNLFLQTGLVHSALCEKSFEETYNTRIYLIVLGCCTSVNSETKQSITKQCLKGTAVGSWSEDGEPKDDWHAGNLRKRGIMGFDVEEDKTKWVHVIIDFRRWLIKEKGHLVCNHDLMVWFTEMMN